MKDTLKQFLKEQEERHQGFHAPIGQYVFKFGALEHDIDACVSNLLGLDYLDHGELVFSQVQSFPARLNLLGALTKKRTKVTELRTRMDEHIAVLKAQNKFRNGLVHGSWSAYLMPDGGEPFWQKIYVNKNNLKQATTEVSLSALKKNTEIIHMTGMLVTNLTQTILKTPVAVFDTGPSPDTP